MNLHLNRFEVLKLICDKFHIIYDDVQDENKATIAVILKNPEVVITWESSDTNTKASPSQDKQEEQRNE